MCREVSRKGVECPLNQRWGTSSDHSQWWAEEVDLRCRQHHRAFLDCRHHLGRRRQGRHLRYAHSAICCGHVQGGHKISAASSIRLIAGTRWWSIPKGQRIRGQHLSLMRWDVDGCQQRRTSCRHDRWSVNCVDIHLGGALDVCRSYASHF